MDVESSPRMDDTAKKQKRRMVKSTHTRFEMDEVVPSASGKRDSDVVEEFKQNGEGAKTVHDVDVKKSSAKGNVEEDETVCEPVPVPRKKVVTVSKIKKAEESTPGTSDVGAGSEARKKRRKSRQLLEGPASMPDTAITLTLNELEEDVIESKNEYSTIGGGEGGTTLVPSQPTSKVYVQQKRGFVAKSREKAMKSSVLNPDQEELSGQLTALDVALLVQAKVEPLTNFCHGLLAGMALWHLVLVYQVFRIDISYLNFVVEYSRICRPFQTGFYLLTVICIFSVLDRYDLAQMNLTRIRSLLTVNPTVLAAVAYVIALILTLCATRIDDKIALSEFNETLWIFGDIADVSSKSCPESNRVVREIWSGDQVYELCTEEEAEVNCWLAINLCRCLAVIIGWVFLSLFTTQNKLYEHIQELTRYKSKEGEILGS